MTIERLPTPDGGGAHDPRPVGDQLDRLLRSLGAPHGRTVRGVHDRWEEIVGEALAAHSRPGSIKGGVLQVIVDDPAWAAELRWMGNQVAEAARAVLNDDSIQRIDVRVEGGRRGK